MKTTATALCMCGLALAGGAHALEVGSGHEASLYFSQPFGASERNQYGSHYGLRVDYARTRAGHAANTPVRVTRMPVVNLRMGAGGTERLDLGGVPVMRADSVGGSAASLGTTTGGLIVGGVIVGAGILCLAEHWICEDDGDDSSGSPESPTSPGLD